MQRSPNGCSRRELLAGAAGAALTLGTGALPFASAQQRRAGGDRLNVLVLLADEQTYNTIYMLGNHAVRTPNIDQLAARGTSMGRCYNQGGWHSSVCMASRAMIQTGRHLFRVVEPHDARKAGNLDTPLTLWPEHFKANGYQTFGVGKWYGNDASIRRCFTAAPALLLGGMHPYNDAGKTAGVPIQTGHRQARLRSFDGKAFEDRVEQGWSTDLFADATIEFIKSRNGQDKPFFAYLGFTAPHDPRHAPRRYMDLYDPDTIELPPNFMAEHPFDFGIQQVRDEVLLDTPRDKQAIRHEIAAYYAMITHIDERIGDLVKALEHAGQADNTLIVFTSDHGLALGQHGLLGKQNLYEHSVRVPMIWMGPGINPGEICEELVYLHSLYATTCELAGLDVPESCDAPSLVPVLAGSGGGERSVYGAYDDLVRSACDGRYKLIHYPKIKRAQLFDLKADPWEMNDLADQPAMKERKLELYARLVSLQGRVGDTLALT